MQQQGRGQEHHHGGARDWVQRDSWKDEAYNRGDRRGRGAGATPFVGKSEILRKILDARNRESLAEWILEVLPPAPPLYPF
jgi:hypothetical protein